MSDESKYPTRIAPYGLRMPEELKGRIQAAAEENLRSMNAEIVARLEASFVTNHAAAMQSPDAGRILESIFAYLAADGWTPPSREVTDNKTSAILAKRGSKNTDT